MSDRRASDELLARRLFKLFGKPEVPPRMLGTTGVTKEKPPFSNPMTAAEDLIVGGPEGAPKRLGKGADDQVLGVAGGSLAWIDQTGGSGSGSGFYRQYVLAVDGSGGFVFIDDGTGHPVTTLEALE